MLAASCGGGQEETAATPTASTPVPASTATLAPVAPVPFAEVATAPSETDWGSVDFDGAEPRELIDSLSLQIADFDTDWFKALVRAYGEAADGGDEVLVLTVAEDAAVDAVARDDADAMRQLIDTSYSWPTVLSSASTQFLSSVDGLRDDLRAAWPDAALRGVDPALLGPQLAAFDPLELTEPVLAAELYSSIVFTRLDGQPVGHIRVDFFEVPFALARLSELAPTTDFGLGRDRLGQDDDAFPDPLRDVDAALVGLMSRDGGYVTGISEGDTTATTSYVYDALTGDVVAYEDQCYVVRQIGDDRYLACDAADGTHWTELRVERGQAEPVVVSQMPDGLVVDEHRAPVWGWHDAAVLAGGTELLQFNAAFECGSSELVWFPTVQLIVDGQPADLRVVGDEVVVGTEGDFARATLRAVREDGVALVSLGSVCDSQMPDGVYAIGPDGDVSFHSPSAGRVVLLPAQAD